jgi:hypothetical protein
MAYKRSLSFFACFPLLFFAEDLQSQDTNIVARLPVKRIVLYKNGLGYFEHVGPVQGKQDVAISFTSGQLNDVLKSLTVLDLNGGRVTSVSYGSSAPADRQLNDLRLPIGEKASLTEFLGALRGARMEVRSGTAVMTGRLLSVERKSRSNGAATVEIDYLSLITDSGEVRTSELAPNFSVRLLDKGLTGKVESYLDFAASGREADVRRMVISTEGTGNRSLFVSYISEVPIWKATYRIVLDSKPNQAPLLQGWAIVDNTVGQDWDKVDLSLVAGAPQSFIQNLSQPYYSRRNVVPLPSSPEPSQIPRVLPFRAPRSRPTMPPGPSLPSLPRTRKATTNSKPCRKAPRAWRSSRLALAARRSAVLPSPTHSRASRTFVSLWDPPRKR